MRYHSLRSRRRLPLRMSLRMAPMIDVVFLLLVFFLLAANFRSREGFLPAQMPRQASQVEQMEMEPLPVQIETLPDGSCVVRIGLTPAIIINDGTAGFDLLSSRIKQIIRNQSRRDNDPIKLIPTPRTKWDHVLKTYDALWRADLRNIIFAIVQ